MKDIPDIPPPILEAAFSGRLIVFIGAGVSRIIGCPSWKDFACQQLKYLYDKRHINYYEYEHLRTLDSRKLQSICSRLIEEKNVSPPNINKLLEGDIQLEKKYKIYENLYSFNAIYITTNYDDYLDKIAEANPIFMERESESDPSEIEEISVQLNRIIYFKKDLLISNLTNGAVIHLHGSVKDSRNVIRTTTDYMNHYVKDSYPAVLLEEIFKNYTVLFVGYGLEEYEILEFIVSRSLVTKRTIQHFMLYPIFKSEVNLLDFHKNYWADLSVGLIEYPIDTNGYEQLDLVIMEWAQKIGRKARPQGFYERIKFIDEVI